MIRYARAYAPGHVTGVFRPASSGRDPRGVGSVGAGLVLDLGAVAEVSWDPLARRRLDAQSTQGQSLPITSEAVEHLRASYPGRIRVTVRPALPVGQGFGMSAAGTLATSLAVASLLNVRRSRAIETAHLAELFGRGGLGGVPAILGGGLEVRRRPGVPPFGEVWHLPWDPAPLFLVRVGPPIPSPRILGDPRWLGRIERASEGLEGLMRQPSRDGFLELSERFTDRLELGSLAFHRTVRALRRTGNWVAQAMFGNTLFVVPRSAHAREGLLQWLTNHGVAAVETNVGRHGARRLPSNALQGTARAPPAEPARR